MNIKLKWVVLFEGMVIIVLLAALIVSYSADKVKENVKVPDDGLLSPRVYSGLLESKSFLILNFAPLKLKLQNYISKNNLNVSVYVENLRNGVWMGVNERAGFFPASLIKLPVAILITKKVENGELSFGTMLSINDSDRTSSFGGLYKTEEKQLPVDVLLERMLKESDNTAFRVLLRQLDTYDFQLILDYYSIDINADFQDGEAANHQNLVSPKSISALFSSLYFSTVLEPDNSEYLLSLLNDSAFDIGHMANIPNDTSIAHKFGETYYIGYKYFHDCGIMYINKSRIFYCVMTKDLDEEKAAETVSVIVNEIYHYVENTKAALSAYKEED